jgi:hypothetical protein
MTFNEARDFSLSRSQYNPALAGGAPDPAKYGVSGTSSNFGNVGDKSANFSWGADLPYDPSVYARQFTWEDYLAKNPDLREAGIDTPWEAATHYANYGKNENRQGVGFLAEDTYKQRQPDYGEIPDSRVFNTQPAPATQPPAGEAAARSLARPPVMDYSAAVETKGLGTSSIPTVSYAPPAAAAQPAQQGPASQAPGPMNFSFFASPDGQQPMGLMQSTVPGFRKGGQPTHFPRKTGPINGPGTGTSDSIPAMLSDGEFVFTARAVRNAGGGSRRKGARRMYKLMKMLEGGKVEGK